MSDLTKHKQGLAAAMSWLEDAVRLWATGTTSDKQFCHEVHEALGQLDEVLRMICFDDEFADKIPAPAPTRREEGA